MERIDRIREMLAESPNDSFLLYSLAMELDKRDQFQESGQLFQQLTEAEPPFVPAFFMWSQSLVRQQQVAEARTLLREGIEQARAQGDSHAAGEMSEFLSTLGQFGE